MLYSYLHVHSASQRHNIKDRRMNKQCMIKTQEASLQLYFTSHFICKVWKGLFKVLHVRGCWRPNINFTFWPHYLWPSRCVFLVLLMLGSTPTGGGSEDPLGRVWLSLPHLVSNSLEVCWQLLDTPNSTELNNNSTPTRSPTGSLKSNV